MNDKYEIMSYMDNLYAVYSKGNYDNLLFRGTIEEVNAWLSLKSKGFDV